MNFEKILSMKNKFIQRLQLINEIENSDINKIKKIIKNYSNHEKTVDTDDK